MESLDESNGFVYKNWRFCLLKLKQAKLAEDKLLRYQELQELQTILLLVPLKESLKSIVCNSCNS